MKMNMNNNQKNITW